MKTSIARVCQLLVVLMSLVAIIAIVVLIRLATVSTCGDGERASGEGVNGCADDCSPTIGLSEVCGDGTCTPGEGSRTCPQDCGVVAVFTPPPMELLPSKVRPENRNEEHALNRYLMVNQ